MASHSQSEWLLDIRTAEGSLAIPHEDTNTRQVKSPADHPRVNRLRRWCYSLHALLCILHLVLLVMFWSHPEHAFTIPFDNSILTVGLSAFLQAFYTLYTILLVFITQRLALSASLSRHQKLTTTHDISEAWGGLGAAILTLWQQTKIAASTFTTILVFLYLACISVLHVASPTIMQFQPYNALLKTVVASNSTWPGPSVNLSALTWAGISPLAPLMSNVNSSTLSTSGLVNTTLYDTFTGNQLVVNASVNATTIRANCGLLPILSGDGVTGINASLSAVENVTIYLEHPWKDEILFLNSAEYQCTTGTCAYHPLLFMVSTAMELDSSIQSPVSVNTTWQFTPIDGAEAQTSSTIVYPVACSLYALRHQSTLDMQHDIMWSTIGQSNVSSQRWSLWSPSNGTDSEPLTMGILAAMFRAEYPTLTEFFCQQYFCPAISTIDLYIMSLLGVNVTANNITAASESSSHPSMNLTPSQMEVSVSRVAAELIWLAGQLGESNGGFALSPTSNDVTEQVPKWRLNINQVPVICVLGASFILVVVVHLMIGGPSATKNTTIDSDGVSVLEMLWISAHTHNLRERFTIVEYPSSETLRSIGMFDVCLAAVKSSDSGFRFKDGSIGEPSLHWQRLIKSKEDKLEAGRTPAQRRRTQMWRPSHLRQICFPTIPPLLFVSCYVLHGFLVASHVALMAVFAHHTEHSVIIPLDSAGITTALSASLQLFYTLYTVVLVFVTQRLALRQMMTSRRDLTTIHDISHAWMGAGPALVGLSRQRKVSVSFWTTLGIMFQTFNSTTVNMVQSTLAWPNSSISLQDLKWADIAPLVPLVTQFPDLSTEGLFASIVYDTPSATPASLDAVVSATTVHAHCGLLSNLSYDPNLGSLNSTVSPLGSILMGVPPMWNNTIVFVNPDHYGCLGCGGYSFFLVTTGMDFDANSLTPGSYVSVTVNQTENIINLANDTDNRIFPIVTYLVGCSLNATTVSDTLDLQSNLLTGPHPADMSAHSHPWTLWSPTNVSELDKGISTAMSNGSLANCPVDSASEMQPCDTFTDLDFYIMAHVGINVTDSALSTGSSAAPAITLNRYQFENAVSEVAAQSIWLAGRMDGGFQPANGTSKVTDIIVQLQLNINIIPLGFALGASITIFLLTFYIVGVTAPRSLAVSSLGVLETWWLESHSQLLHDRMLEIDDPSVNNLRSAGMLEVCLADELTTTKGDDERDQDDNRSMTEHDTETIHLVPL